MNAELAAQRMSLDCSKIAALVAAWGRVARATGLEPATSGVTGRHSNRLSYARALLSHRVPRAGVSRDGGALVPVIGHTVKWCLAYPQEERRRTGSGFLPGERQSLVLTEKTS